MSLSVAFGMQQHPVLHGLRSSQHPPDEMVVVPARQEGDLLVADRTETVLFPPKGLQRAFSPEVVRHLHTEALLPIDFPLRVIRIRLPFDLDVPLDRRSGGMAQPILPRLSLVVGRFPEEAPVSLPGGPEILLGD